MCVCVHVCKYVDLSSNKFEAMRTNTKAYKLNSVSKCNTLRCAAHGHMHYEAHKRVFIVAQGDSSLQQQ